MSRVNSRSSGQWWVCSAAFPRIVKHTDEGFIAATTKLYRSLIPENGRVLDLMSSWVSHLPQDERYAEVVGHGMNKAEVTPYASNSKFSIVGHCCIFSCLWSLVTSQNDRFLPWKRSRVQFLSEHFQSKVLSCISNSFALRTWTLFQIIATKNSVRVERVMNHCIITDQWSDPVEKWKTLNLVVWSSIDLCLFPLWYPDSSLWGTSVSQTNRPSFCRDTTNATLQGKLNLAKNESFKIREIV